MAEKRDRQPRNPSRDLVFDEAPELIEDREPDDEDVEDTDEDAIVDEEEPGERRRPTPSGSGSSRR